MNSYHYICMIFAEKKQEKNVIYIGCWKSKNRKTQKEKKIVNITLTYRILKWRVVTMDCQPTLVLVETHLSSANRCRPCRSLETFSSTLPNRLDQLIEQEKLWYVVLKKKKIINIFLFLHDDNVWSSFFKRVFK